MILQSLCEYYARAARDSTRDLAPYGYSESPISFAAVLDASGRVRTILPLQPPEDKKKRGIAMQTPSLGKARASGIAANFLWDNPGYVFGVDGKGKAKRALDSHAAFATLHERLLGDAEDPGLKAVLAFVRSWRPEDASALPHWEAMMEATANNIAFRLDGADRYVHDNDEARRIWSRHLDGGDDPAVAGRCLVTGEHTAIAQLHPMIKGVYGAQSSGAGLSTYNMASAKSFGKEQNRNAPVGKYAAFAYTTALNSLLADDKRRLGLGDSTLVVWADEPSDAEEFFIDLINPPQEGQAKDDGRKIDDPTANRIWTLLDKLADGKNADGEIETLNPDARFHLLCLAPNAARAARLAVRFHVADTLRHLLELSGQHFSRLRIVRRFESDPHFPSPYLLARELAGKHKKPKDLQRLTSDIVRTIVTGGRYPQYLLAMAIDRIRAERDVTYCKAAIIKAILIRNQQKEISMSLNPDSPDAAYQLGRLFALLEGVQRKAIPGINAGIRDRFYGAASSTPASVFPLLLKNAQHHIGKAKAGGYDKLIGEVLSHIDSTGFPAHLTLERQGQFALGYYHQRYTRQDESQPDESEQEKDGEE